MRHALSHRRAAPQDRLQGLKRVLSSRRQLRRKLVHRLAGRCSWCRGRSEPFQRTECCCLGATQRLKGLDPRTRRWRRNLRPSAPTSRVQKSCSRSCSRACRLQKRRAPVQQCTRQHRSPEAGQPRSRRNQNTLNAGQGRGSTNMSSTETWERV
eukprot:230552-Rhodomonas_salina.1